ncbi:Mitochondrial carrier protein ymc2 [Coemansia thaxteri]|uniref:Mitochondrial carrier protein ymc2 n=1 Tax=Coemansia thaxteri TaxID=2663907 RepID=A0A9W8BI66_9FUNG|nr:Mitochondrial carrier protein ymc2 [Coemansia thaxteri]KAJ2002514.1 Mitochondrial carrier protein ymc2 [Coemansia thaxteri]KAJ2467879.1 Mitochondrial carrier protein ymc2 [Coemansia sp. RSA 2322]KAJ2478558.1 Mitochondrial carrier protein ymc2 [Coemansia sp. RSA 2320]
MSQAEPHGAAEDNEGVMRAVKDCLAGSVGGVAQVFAGQPFDTVKVRLQTQPEMYRGMADAVRKTIQNDGFSGFYKGTTTPLVGVGLCVSIQFLVMEHMKRTFAKANGTRGGQASSLSAAQLYMAGATAGVANSIVSGPVEHIRVRLQVQTAGSAAQYKGPLDCIRQIYRGFGWSGIYKGQVATVLREFNGYGMYFLAYEALVQRTIQQTGKKRAELSSGLVCMYGAAAGFAMWLTSYPIDVVKSKLQTDGFSAGARKYNGTVDCIRKVMQQEGARGFFRGITPCLLRAAPANAATFIGFEMAMRVLG